MNDNGLGSVIVARGVVHGGIFIEVLISIPIRTTLPGECSRAVIVHSGFLLCVEAILLLEAKGKTLVISLEEFAAKASQPAHCIQLRARTQAIQEWAYEKDKEGSSGIKYLRTYCTFSA